MFDVYNGKNSENPMQVILDYSIIFHSLILSYIVNSVQKSDNYVA